MGLSSGLLITNQLSAHPATPSPSSSSNTAAASNHCASSGHGCAVPAKNQSQADSQAKDYSDDPNNGNMNYHLMTEDELLIELSDEGINTYKKLTPEGKALAREVASMRCNNTNPCRALNACKTSKNDCAGKGACQGQGKCAISDKNLAIKLVSEKMADKRENATKKP